MRVALAWVTRDLSTALPMASEHLGLAYIAAVLRQHGIECVIQPVILPQNPPTVIYVHELSGYEGEVIRRAAEDIDSYDPDVVGISIPFQEDALAGCALASKVKRLLGKAVVLVGGHFPSFNASAILAEHVEIDGVVIGEGEMTLLDVVSSLGALGELVPVPGLMVRGSAYSGRALISDLDSLPYPARDILAWMQKNAYPVKEAYISGSRGCYGRCVYCSVRSFYSLAGGPRWRGRSPKCIVSEMVAVREKYGIPTFCFCDDEFIGPGRGGLRRAQELARLLKSVGGFSFRFSCRANDVREDLFQELVAAGLESVFLGIESGSDIGLRRLGKGITVQENLAALRILRRLGIGVMPGFIAITPWTTLEDLQSDLRFLLEAELSGPLALLARKLRVYSGTEVHTNLHKDGKLLGDYRWYEYELADPRVEVVLRALELYSSRVVPERNKQIASTSAGLGRSILILRHRQARSSIITRLLEAKTLEDCYELLEMIHEEAGPGE